MSAGSVRLRRSLQSLEDDYSNGNKKALEDLVRAFKGIQELPPDDENSWWVIAGYHGEPHSLQPVDQEGTDWNGGYCPHGTILFPTWHRAYVLRFEDALRSIPGCEDVCLPYWDELAGRKSPNNTIPSILTTPTFTLDGESIRNPLCSYTLAESLVDPEEQQIVKPDKYTTKRYPYSGLASDTAYDKDLDEHHSNIIVPALNRNIFFAITGLFEDQKVPSNNDLSSVESKYLIALSVDDYLHFSNRESVRIPVADPKADDITLYALEQPHDDMHVYSGRFYNEDWNQRLYGLTLEKSKGDMTFVDFAAFDPLFWFHHCYVDHVFSIWQTLHRAKTADATAMVLPETGLGVITDKGLPVPEGEPELPPNTQLTLQTPLYPFRNSQDPTKYWKSEDVLDIEQQLGYTYEDSTVQTLVQRDKTPKASFVKHVVGVHGIDRTPIRGSFVVKVFAKKPDGQEIEAGRQSVFSLLDVKRCANCQSSLVMSVHIPISDRFVDHLSKNGYGGPDQIKYVARIYPALGTDQITIPPRQVVKEELPLSHES